MSTELSSSEASMRVDKFVELTSSDEIVGQMFLQDHEWHLDKAVNAFFDSQASSVTSSKTTTAPPTRLTLVSWNVDGMNEKNVNKRMDAVAKEVEENRADVVCLQEVTSDSLHRLSRLLPRFQIVEQSQPEGVDYFTAILINRGSVYVDAIDCHMYISSRMGRALQSVRLHMGDTKLEVFNTHLESTKEHAKERIKQLKMCLDTMTNNNEGEFNQILTGDLNLRDNELASLGGLPKSIFDMWSHMGGREECKFTWDAQRNTNIEIPGRFKPRCRFDRTLCRIASKHGMRPQHFGLIGIGKVIGTQVFPSDHWGIISVFDIN